MLKILLLSVFNESFNQFIFFKRMNCFFVLRIYHGRVVVYFIDWFFICERNKWMQVVKETTERREKEMK